MPIPEKFSPTEIAHMRILVAIILGTRRPYRIGYGTKAFPCQDKLLIETALNSYIYNNTRPQELVNYIATLN